jgi:hypothetical protein
VSGQGCVEGFGGVGVPTRRLLDGCDRAAEKHRPKEVPMAASIAILKMIARSYRRAQWIYGGPVNMIWPWTIMVRPPRMVDSHAQRPQLTNTK